MRILVLCQGGPENGWNEFVDIDDDGERLLYFDHRYRPGSVYLITDEQTDSPLGRARIARLQRD